MEKQWYLSKTIWTAVFIGVAGIVEAFGYPIPEVVYSVAAAIGIYSMRTAIK